MADLPLCHKFKNGLCPRSDVYLVSDQDANGSVWSLRCRTCGCCMVMTKPTGKAAGRYRAQQERLRRQQEAVRRRESRPRLFT